MKKIISTKTPSGRLLPPKWFEFEITDNDSGDCIQCYAEATNQSYIVDLSGKPPYRLPLCEKHRDQMNKKELQSISIGYVGQWGSTGRQFIINEEIVEDLSRFQRMKNYVKGIFRKV